MPVSVLILTKDEEVNLPVCLGSLSWADDVVVLDSGSTDRTEEIAREYGARVVFRKFDDYASQRNYGLIEIDYKYDWILMVDADESVPLDLAQEILRATDAPEEDVALYRMRRKDYFMGKWLRHSSGYPTWFGRLARVGRVHVERAINEEYHADGRVSELDAHLHHYPFNKGIHAWLEKHNRYSTMEAAEKVAKRPFDFVWAELISSDPVQRRRAQKALIYSLPGRPLLVFLLLFVVRGGFLDGRAGFTLCVLKAFYEFMIDCKVREILWREKGRPF